jgi:hypothetical protein
MHTKDSLTFSIYLLSDFALPLFFHLRKDQIAHCKDPSMQPVRLAGGWWLVLISFERKVMLAGC